MCKNNWTHLCCLLYFSSAFQKQRKLCTLPLHHTSSHHFEIQHLNNITFKYELLNSHPTPNNSINWPIYGLLSTSSGFVCILLRYFVLWILSLSILVLMTAKPPLVLGSVVLFKSQPCFHGFSICSVLPSDLESPGTASVLLRVQNSWRRSQFFSQSGKMHTGELYFFFAKSMLWATNYIWYFSSFLIPGTHS